MTKIYKLNHLKLGELEVKISSVSRCWLKLGDIEQYCELCYIEQKDVYALSFGKIITINNEKISGVKITKTDYEAIVQIAKDIETETLQEEYNEFLERQEVSYSTSSSTGFYLPEKLRDKYSSKVHDNVKAILKEKTTCDTDWGDYSVTYTFKCSGKELIDLLDKELISYNEKVKEKEKKEKEKEDAIFKKAQETGQKQELYRYIEDCNDDREDCDVDIIIIYAMPDGSKSVERNHTW